MVQNLTYENAHRGSSLSGDVGRGTQLGRYEIVLGIAQGGMARVWAARQTGQRGFQKVVAIKTILPQLASDPAFEAMFLDEARVASGIHHPNVCEIFDLGEEAGVLYLAMEWVDGDSLARILKEPQVDPAAGTVQPINARIAARIVSDAAAGLHAAHELSDFNGLPLKVVHRDVSPQNILLGMNGTVKVTDFGVAKALGQISEATVVGEVKGKTAYMSPEQASGTQVDRRSDVFALGIVLYETTTGRRPFKGANQLATLKQVTEVRFDPPSAVAPNYPPELEAIVMRAMAKHPDHRFATAEDMRLALEEWLARSGPIVTQRQVAQVVKDRVGGIIDQRTSKIRDYLLTAGEGRREQQSFPGPASGENSSSSLIPSSGSASSSGSVVSGIQVSTGSPAVVTGTTSTSRKPRSAVSSALYGVGIGLGIFVVIGGIGAGAWALLRNQPGNAAVDSTESTSAAAAPDVAERIQLKSVVPQTGMTFDLDGEELPESAGSVPRPEEGVVRILVARAPGYEDETIKITHSSPDRIDIALSTAAAPPVDIDLDGQKTSGDEERAKAAPDPEPTKPAGDAPPASDPKPAAAKPRPAPAPKPVQPDIPDNPF